jgi:hypothetical protein
LRLHTTPLHHLRGFLQFIALCAVLEKSNFGPLVSMTQNSW